MNYSETVLSYFGAYLGGAIFTAFCAALVVLYEVTILEGLLAVVLFGASFVIIGLLWGEFEDDEEVEA